MGSSVRSFAVAALVAALSFPAEAAAQGDADTRGRVLFDEGKKAMDAKDYATACSKFEASYVVSGVPGALLSWADCEEKRERYATALSLWKQGEAKVVSNEERRQFVKQRQIDVLPKVSWLELRLPTDPVVDLVVTVDGRTVDVTKGALPVDSGKHEVTATGKNAGTHRHAIDVAVGQRVGVELFSKESAVTTPGGPEAVPDAQPPPTSGEGAEGSGMPLIVAGSVVGGVGVASFVVFGVTGGLILSSCGDLGSCPASERDGVEPLAITNAATLGVGIAGVVTGVILIAVGATAEPSSETPSRTTAEPTVQVTSFSDGGLLFTGRF
jgi:hypothetical protein